MSRFSYPFAAIMGQDEMKLAPVFTVINPAAPGVLICGNKGTAKSTAVRGLAELLPKRVEVGVTPYHLSPVECRGYWEELGLPAQDDLAERRTRVPVVGLPIGATEDRVAGTLDLGTVLAAGRERFEPGLLVDAHRGILYVNEVNLLDDHMVDLLLDSTTIGISTVEREDISLTHPAWFSLVGTMNPEEGELRLQLPDRFGLCITAVGESDPPARVEIIECRLAFGVDPVGLCAGWCTEGERPARQITPAMDLLSEVTAGHEVLLEVARICVDAGVDDHRADVTMVRAARALVAQHGRTGVETADLQQVIRLVLPHRMRRRLLGGIGTLYGRGWRTPAARLAAVSTSMRKWSPIAPSSVPDRAGRGHPPAAGWRCLRWGIRLGRTAVVQSREASASDVVSRRWRSSPGTRSSTASGSGPGG